MADLSFALEISEYGNLVRKYEDKDKTRFLEKTKQIVNEHLDKFSNQSVGEIKNIRINIYTN